LFFGRQKLARRRLLNSATNRHKENSKVRESGADESYEKKTQWKRGEYVKTRVNLTQEEKILWLRDTKRKLGLPKERITLKGTQPQNSIYIYGVCQKNVKKEGHMKGKSGAQEWVQFLL